MAKVLLLGFTLIFIIYISIIIICANIDFEKGNHIQEKEQIDDRIYIRVFHRNIADNFVDIVRAKRKKQR